MKKILLIAILAFWMNANAQDSLMYIDNDGSEAVIATDINGYFYLDKGGSGLYLNEIARLSADSLILTIYGVEIPTLYAHEKYIRECYNDSLLVSKYDTIRGLFLGGYNLNKSEFYPLSGYRHKTPTFEGFLNWIEKK